MKETKIAIIGAGTQAKAVLDYLLRYSGVSEIGILDKDFRPFDILNKHIKDNFNNSDQIFEKVSFTQISLNSSHFIHWLSQFDAAISCAPYFLNLELTEKAIEAKTHFTDLGGNTDIVKAQLALSEKAKDAGILVVPDLGLAPGMVGLLGADLVRSLKGPNKELKLMVGGLPISPKPPLNYSLSFSIHGLINEYIEDCEIIERGVKKTVPGLSMLENLPLDTFEAHCYEAFATSGGASTLTDTLLGKVDFLEYKTIRYKGHCDQIKLLQEMGYFKEDVIDDTKKRLLNILPAFTPDLIKMNIIANSDIEHKKIKMINYGEPGRGISAMAKCTGFPAAIITSMIARGEVTARGVVPQENCIDVDSFKHFLLGCGINVS